MTLSTCVSLKFIILEENHLKKSTKPLPEIKIHSLITLEILDTLLMFLFGSIHVFM